MAAIRLVPFHAALDGAATERVLSRSSTTPGLEGYVGSVGPSIT